jgi:hypothetical protein
MNIIETTANAVPPKINGILLPIGVFTLSERAPKSGSINSARTLSIAITTPAIVSPILNVFFNISGTRLSYTCQNAQIDKNARPIIKVRL